MAAVFGADLWHRVDLADRLAGKQPARPKRCAVDIIGLHLVGLLRGGKHYPWVSIGGDNWADPSFHGDEYVRGDLIAACGHRHG